MIRLKDKYTAKKALAIMGGPSIIENNIDLAKIDKSKYIVFLESKSLTPRFLQYGLEPDYYLMFYPEKCVSNSFQHVVYQSFLADIDLTNLLKPDYVSEYNDLKNNFDKFFITWRPHKCPHKRYKFKDGIFLNNSPFSLLDKLKEAKIITYVKAFESFKDKFNFNNKVYSYDLMQGTSNFNLEDYFSLREENGYLYIKDYSFLNSAAIALFPLLKYMGFEKVYFLGMDMSMLGSMEYASCYTFKSMKHYEQFFKKARKVFSAVFKENRRKFMRPPYEFDNLKKILGSNIERIEFINVYNKFGYSLPLEGIRNLSYEEFCNE